MSREGIPGCRNISHANRTTQVKQAQGLLKERKRTYAPNCGHRQARKKGNCLEEQRNLELYLNEGAKYSGFLLTSLPRVVLC